MPKKIINIDEARKRTQGEAPDLYAVLARIDELEDILDTMDELGISTRGELEALIAKLEADAERLDHDPKS